MNFFELLPTLVQTASIDIILGDFNINAFSKNHNLCEVLSDFKQIVKEPTHIAGGLLDHVYIKNQLLETFQVQTQLRYINYTDHDAVVIHLV